MPLKTIAIKFPDPEIPFEAASELLSHLAYAEDAHRQRSFGDALCRFAHLEESIRNSDWAFSAHQIRPRILVATANAFAKNLHEGLKRLDSRLGVSLNAMMPHILDFAAPDGYERTAEDALPSLNKTIRTILNRKGRSEGSRSTLITDVWTPMKPVFHLAFTYAFVVFFKPVYGNYNRNGRSMMEIITPFPNKNTLLEIIDYAETTRTLLPAMKDLDFREDETIKFVAET
jgi:hypothetical protein